MPFRTFEVSDPRFTHDGLRWVTVRSDSLRGRGDVTLYVHPGAEAAGARDVPVVILLHGVYGSHWAWALKGGAHRTTARMIDAGELSPVVLAMPGDGLRGDGSGYVRQVGFDFEHWIVHEVPEVAREAVSGVSKESPLLLAGLSMGGFGALRLGAKYPERFRALSGHSSATLAEQFRAFASNGIEEWSNAPEDRSVIAAMERSRGRLPPIPFDCGTEDPLLEGNRVLHRELEAAGIPHLYEEFPGGHTWDYWETHLVDTLRFFAERLKSP